MLFLCMGDWNGNSNNEVGCFNALFIKVYFLYRENGQIIKKVCNSTDFCF